MSDHLITEILKTEEEADRIVQEAKQKAGEIVANIHREVESIKTNMENEYRQKLELLKTKTAKQRDSGEEGLKNETELLKGKLLQIDSKSMEDAVSWVVKHIYES